MDPLIFPYGVNVTLCRHVVKSKLFLDKIIPSYYNYSMKTEEMDKTTLRLPPAEMKALKMFVLEHDTTVQSFLVNAVRYCMKNKILPKEK